MEEMWRMASCNPLAGIEVFHTPDAPGIRQARLGLVVIPWRGLRCFTLTRSRHTGWAFGNAFVVIPWRGLRCFTRQSNSTASGRRRQVAERGRSI